MMVAIIVNNNRITGHFCCESYRVQYLPGTTIQ
jgi:hypothetical protein